MAQWNWHCNLDYCNPLCLATTRLEWKQTPTDRGVSDLSASRRTQTHISSLIHIYFHGGTSPSIQPENIWYNALFFLFCPAAHELFFICAAWGRKVNPRLAGCCHLNAAGVSDLIYNAGQKKNGTTVLPWGKSFCFALMSKRGNIVQVHMVSIVSVLLHVSLKKKMK